MMMQKLRSVASGLFLVPRDTTILLLVFLSRCGVCQVPENIALHSALVDKQAMPHLAAARDTGGNVHLAVLYRHQPGSGVVKQAIAHWYSSDEGSTWIGQDTFALALNDYTTYSNNNDPNVAYDLSHGYAYATFLSTEQRYLARSTDWGNTWSATGPQTSGLSPDAPVIAVDNDPGSSYAGAVYVAMSDGQTVTVLRSTDQGATDTVVASGLHYVDLGSCLPQIAVGKNGVIYLFSSGGYFNYSTDAGATWGYGSSGTTLITDYEGDPKCYSMTCSPTSDTVCFAYRDATGKIWFAFTADSGQSLHKSAKAASPRGTLPVVSIDAKGYVYVGSYSSTDSVVSLSVSLSKDFGLNWISYVVSAAPAINAELDKDGVGAYFGLAALDSEHVYIAWSDNHTGQYRVYFSKLNTKGVQFRNELSGIYSVGHHVIDASGTPDTVASLSIVNFSSTASHTTQPDSFRYGNVIANHGSNFRFLHFNQGTLTSDTAFTHSFNGNVGLPKSEEANFVHVDTLRVVADCDGLVDHGGVGLKNSVDTIWKAGTSPIFIDTALRTSDYDVRTDDSVITINGVNYYFDRWENGDDSLTNQSTFSVNGDTTIHAFFKGTMHATNHLTFNNQRKLAWANIGNAISYPPRSIRNP